MRDRSPGGRNLAGGEPERAVLRGGQPPQDASCRPSPVPAACCAANCSNIRTAKEAAAHAAKELAKGLYAGANYVCADGRYAAVVHGGDKVEIVELSPGLHVVTNGNVDDPRDERHEFVRRMLTLHTLDSAVTFLAVASRVFSRKPDSEGRRGVVLLGSEFGTVSSTLLSLPRKIQHAVYQYAPGPPCDYRLRRSLRPVAAGALDRTQPQEPRGQRRIPQAPLRQSRKSKPRPPPEKGS